MGLQRIFSTTTIIVGLFISVDYGLCDEFKCRGYEREHHSDDAGEWSWQTHSIWTAIYILGLAFFAFCFTLLERCLLSSSVMVTFQVSNARFFTCYFQDPSGNLGISPSLLSTVSRLVSGGNPNNACSSGTRMINGIQARKSPFAMHLAFWLHLAGLLVTTCLFWTDIVPTIGKVSYERCWIFCC